MEDIISRGRSVRARRRLPALAGAAAAAACTAAVVVLVPGHQAAPKVQLTAWTVTRQAGGEVTVTLRELRNPAGLESALHAAGVPAYVAFASTAPAQCAVYPAGPSQQQAMYQFRQGHGRAEVTINPSAIPAGARLLVMDVPATPENGKLLANSVGGRRVHIGVVSASSQCPLS
ncbi:MAG TPA: hypothetical protein VGG35_19645 [Streptosporangiaceae bacterium]